MGMLYLIRHGQASFGEISYDKLSDRGTKQAELLGDYLIQTNTNFEYMVSGTLERQHHTAATLMATMGSHILSSDLRLLTEFNEYDSEGVFREILPSIMANDIRASYDGYHMMKDGKAFQRTLDRVLDRWMGMEPGEYEVESWDTFKKRVLRAIENLDLSGKKKVAAVTSGGVIAACMHLFLDVPPRRAMALSWQCLNSSMTIWLTGKKGLRLYAWNLAPHLELCGNPDMITYR
ncbi:phosphoglycerate mutase family protein [Desulfobotulus sp. H1]|uniref:Phosphoglycerate mutase family protein n=1 Tax=Desulfobotulus pelophilus TaxID=2823377 RepID=A0ABT3N895_9BACT|nr:histidine phosphatase family protein [Desulfobotulus pelophilus]MCW7753683.1 phosphoglycerate mutase family protein [Desulfobotulus pelophilus]